MLSGNLHEVRYEWPNNQKSDEDLNNNCPKPEEMRAIGESQLKTNHVAYINGKNRIFKLKLFFLNF